MVTTDQYLGLITSEHRNKPLFAAAVSALVAGLVDNQNVLAALTNDFDLDVAVGAQLDAVGEWIGLSRRLDVPLDNVYFSWNSTAALGWGSGIWKGKFDPDSGLVLLPDYAYRNLLKAKIAANNWDGTLAGAEAIWNQAFGGGQNIIIQDNQDMTMVVGFAGAPLDAIQQALLVGGYLPLKPAGVRISYFAVPVDTNPLFAWNVAASASLAGWGAGSWARQL